MRVALVVLALLAAAPAQAGVRVVPPFDPAEYADRAAVGLLVPGAGPTVTRESALAALLRGELEHGLLGGIAAGEPLIELGAPGGPEILVSLPPPGRSDNDVRYPIALLGERGLLTSDSTRIDGLVSVTDVATGPPARRAERRSGAGARDARRPDRAERPLAAAADDRARGAPDRARVRPARARRCGRSSSRSPRTSGSARCSRSRPASPSLLLPLGLGVRGDPRAPTSSRWGSTPRRSRSRRSAPPSPAASTGSTTCSRRCCSRPRSSARRCSAAPGSASPRSRSSRSAATASAPTAAGSSCSPPPISSSGCGCAASGRRCGWRGWSPPAPSRSRFSCSASTRRPEARATSPTRSATARPRSPATSPTGSSSPCAARLRAPARSSSCSARSRSWSRSRFVARRNAVLDAFLVGLAVSLVVNDTPGDVLGIGAAIAIALARHPPRHGWLDSAPMRRAALLLALLALSAGLAGCGGGEEVSPTPETVVGTLPEATTGTTRSRRRRSRATPRTATRSSPRPGCGGCHTLEAAGSSGTVGPNLDDSQPDLSLVVDRVTNGQGAMPALLGQLSEQEIADVAAYVVESTSADPSRRLSRATSLRSRATSTAR